MDVLFSFIEFFTHSGNGSLSMSSFFTSLFKALIQRSSSPSAKEKKWTEARRNYEDNLCNNFNI